MFQWGKKTCHRKNLYKYDDTFFFSRNIIGGLVKKKKLSNMEVLSACKECNKLGHRNNMRCFTDLFTPQDPLYGEKYIQWEEENKNKYYCKSHSEMSRCVECGCWGHTEDMTRYIDLNTYRGVSRGEKYMKWKNEHKNQYYCSHCNT